MTQRGKDAENTACEYLRQQGLKLLLCNYRTPRGELDLVMREGQTLVVVEVRSRSNPRFGGALASIDRRKRERIILATQLLLAQQRSLSRGPIRFDVIAFEPTGKLHWIRGAFSAGLD